MALPSETHRKCGASLRGLRRGWVAANMCRSGFLDCAQMDSGEEVQVEMAICHLQEPNKHGVDDMTNLSYLNEPNVLDNLRLRYERDQI